MTPEATVRTRPVAVLTGFMGAGKSTVGVALARLLGVEFTDTDHEIVARSGRGVADIFATDGEEYFRAFEAQVVADVLETRSGVVALGGGAVMTPSVREALRGHRVVYLDVTPDAGFARVRSSQRPLLRADDTAPDPEHRYRQLLADRSDTYRRTAELITDTTDRAPAVLADEIARALGVTPAAASRRDRGLAQ